MAEFVLVHGAMHGAWCWDRLQPELDALGHSAFAMDMPIDRPGLSMNDYADHVVGSLAGRGVGQVYVVGHSMGGYVIPKVAEALPGVRLIFLCAVLMHTSEAELRENRDATSPDFSGWIEADSEGRMTMSRENAREGFYGDVDPALADWAISKLRPQWPAFMKVGPAAPYADRVAGVIYTQDDRIILPAIHRRLAFARFGREPIALPGDHSPFLSRPAELATALDEIARTDRG